MLGFKKKSKVNGDAENEKDVKKAVNKAGKIALCLGGGGMRGFAHIGAIKALRENNVKFDMVCGTSIGALVAALYALDVSYDEMLERVGGFRFKKLHNGFPFPSNNPLKIERVVRELVGDINIEELFVPYFCVAVDVLSGQQVIFDKGPLYQAVTCSCNLPILFKPYPLEDKRLSDGGLKNNIPAATARMLGADKVITVDVNPTRGSGTENIGYIGMVMATLDMAISNSSVEGLINSDVIIAPDMSRFKATDESGWGSMIKIGYDTAMEQMDTIIKIVENKKLY